MHTRAIIKATNEVVTIDTSLVLRTSSHEYLYHTADKTKIFREEELIMLDNRNYWEFIEQWHPNYNSSQRVAESNDLQSCLDGEADDDKLAEVTRWCGNTPEDWIKELKRIDTMLFNEALDNFLHQKYSAQ